MQREESSAYRLQVRKSESGRPLRRHPRRWNDNIKMDLKETVGI
jgi:hypothetical protein